MLKDSNADIIWNYFIDKGLTPAGVAGLMGNLYAESGLNPKNLQNTFNTKLKLSDEEYTKQVDNGKYTNFVYDKAGYGLAQWTYWSRKKALLKFVGSKKQSIGNLEVQLDFLYQELATTFPQLLKLLSEESSVQKTSDEVLTKFEKPAGDLTQLKKTRYNYAIKYYEEYKKEVSGMKYTSSNPPYICLQDDSSCYNNTTKMKNILGVLWHSTGANNPNLKRYVQPSDDDAKKREKLALLGTNLYKNDMNHKAYQMGVNAWIGKAADGTVMTVQALPWEYRPWGCGGGAKGSCNDGWIQFEICEDNLNNKAYFDKIYKEACELTAFLLNKYKLNPYDTQTIKGVKIPVITCHAEAASLGFASNHGDIFHWFNKYGKTMDNIRDDVAKIMNIINNKPKEEVNSELKEGDEIQLREGATYISGGKIPAWVTNTPLYYRGEQGENGIIFSTLKTGAITGVVKVEDVINPKEVVEFEPYEIIVNTNVLNVRAEPNTSSAVRAQIRKNWRYTIIAEENGWGKLKSKIGWINLDYVNKVEKDNG